MKKIKVGVIGSGGIARSGHLPNYRKIENVEIVAGADINLETAKKASEEFAVPHSFANYEELLGIDEIDAVSICTPNAFHASASISALEAGGPSYILFFLGRSLRVSDLFCIQFFNLLYRSLLASLVS